MPAIMTGNCNSPSWPVISFLVCQSAEWFPSTYIRPAASKMAALELGETFLVVGSANFDKIPR